MSRSSFSVLIAVTLGTFSCGGLQPRSFQQVAPVPASASTGEIDGRCKLRDRTPLPPESPRLLELAGLSNPARLMVWREQERGAGRYAAAPPSGGGFPGVEFTTVRAYVHRFTEAGSNPVLDSALPDCDEHVLSTDGRLCPSVVYPGVVLDSEQVARLVGYTRAPKSTWQYGCIYDPHHSFVFYDKRDRPVSSIQVCFSCGEWALGEGSNRPMTPEVSLGVRALCRDLGLPECPLEDPDDDEEEAADPVRSAPSPRELYWNWLRSGAPARPSHELRIPARTWLSSLSKVQRKQLCAWRILETGGHHRQERSTSISFNTLDFATCVATFPSCDVPLEEIEQANFYYDNERGFSATPACLDAWLTAPRHECLWGLQIDYGGKDSGT